MPRLDAMAGSFEEVTILDMPALFTPGRVDRGTVPQGYYLYEIRHDDDCQGDAVQVSMSILVNHWGSIVTNAEIPLPSDGCLDIDPEDMAYDAGDCHTMGDFMVKYPVYL